MPCLCGLKVDRNRAKIQCARCSELFHLSCAGISAADVEFLLASNQKYFCVNCAAIRRRSIRSPPPPVCDDQSAIFANLSSTNSPVSTNLCANILPQQQGPEPVQAVITAVNESNSHISLQTVLTEIAALQTENARAMSAISSLQEDKQLLISKIMELCADIKEMRTHQMNDVSSALAQLTAEVKDLRVCVLACECHANKTKKAKSKAKKQELLLPTATSATTVNLPTHPPVDAGANNSQSVDEIVPDHSYAAALAESTEQCEVNAIKLVRSTAHGKSAISTYADVLVADAVNAVNATTANTISLRSSSTANIAPTAQKGNVKTDNQPSKKLQGIVGSNTSNELKVAYRVKWLHLSSFANSVTTDTIISYVSKHASIDSSMISCHMLVKKDVDIKTLKRINFKLSIPASHYDNLLNSALWPTDVIVRPFEFFRKDASVQPKP